MGINRKSTHSRERQSVRTAAFSTLSNLVLCFVKLAAGILGNSFALVADAIESATDVLSSTLVLLGLRYSRKPPDANHPYGHGKIEPVVTFVVVAFLVTSATLIAYRGIENIRSPQVVPESWTLIVLASIVVWKELSYRMVRRTSILTDSTALRAEAWHHRSDAITSIVAFAGIATAVVLGDRFAVADDWAALAAAGIILYNSYIIFRPALGEIMDEHLYDDLVDEIRLIASEVEGIRGTEKCYIRKAGLRYHVELHALVDADITVKKGHELSHALKNTLYGELDNLGSIVIHIEPA